MIKAGSKFFYSAYIMLCSLIFSGCETVDLYEKNVSVPKHNWSSSFKPEFNFTIKDTTFPYQIYVVLRHNEEYRYNNIWVALTVLPPGDTAHKDKFELTLASNKNGEWLGTGMDDIYEHRIAVTPAPIKLKKGDYRFTLEQIMRDEPLENIMNVGLRVERKVREEEKLKF